MENYVFVIGAGASKEFNLPTGEELKSDISNLLNIKFEMMNLISGDYELTRSLQLHSKNQKENFSDYQDCAIKILT